jgi:predicted AAA+ superfamily ATPase
VLSEVIRFDPRAMPDFPSESITIPSEVTLMREKKIVIIAGPNGAGKTTFAREFLPNEAGCPIFVNADLIAAGLSPFQP